MPTTPYGLCHCGCGQPTKIAPQMHTKKGWVKGEPQPYLHGHRGRKPEPKVNSAGCWIIKQKSVYPVIFREGKMQLAARYYYRQSRGPIPEGLQLDHLCRNTKCVNPDHLEVVTPAVNCQRRPTTKLSPEDVRMIRESTANHSQTARMFGVNRSHIAEIRAGRARRNG